MAAKRVDPLKAKAAKQKKIAIAGTVLLVALVAIQGPKTMKLLQGPQPIAQPTATPTSAAPVPAPAAGTDTTGAVAAGAVPPTVAVELASIPNSDQAPAVEDGQLASFERFSSKDPFAQQAAAPVAAPTAAPAEPAAVNATPAKPAAGPTAGTGAAEQSDGGGAAVEPVGGFTKTEATPPAVQAPAIATATSIAVNGAAEDVKPEEPFPAAQPTFVLVSAAPDGKSVRIGIDGGQYADGGETLKLVFGKKVTLQNTADGSRFQLELLSIQGFPLPKRKG